MGQKLSWLNLRQALGETVSWLRSTWEPIKIAVVILLAINSIGLGTQFFRWGNYATDATYYELRMLLVGKNAKDLIALASISQVIEDTERANNYLMEVLKIDRNNALAQANLGISYANAGEWSKAQLYLESYLANGGGSYEALYWYGKAFLKLGELEKGISWLYNSLFVNPTFESAAQELFEWLLQLNRKPEAFSALGAITRGESRSFLGTYQRQQILWERDEEREDLEKNHEVRLPSFEGTRFYIPISLVQGRSSDFMLIRQNIKESMLDLDILMQRRIPFEVVEDRKSKKTPELTTVRIKKVKLADWFIEDLRIKTCSGCQNVMGADLLKKFSLERWEEKGVNFLYLRRR